MKAFAEVVRISYFADLTEVSCYGDSCSPLPCPFPHGSTLPTLTTLALRRVRKGVVSGENISGFAMPGRSTALKSGVPILPVGQIHFFVGPIHDYDSESTVQAQVSTWSRPMSATYSSTDARVSYLASSNLEPPEMQISSNGIAVRTEKFSKSRIGKCLYGGSFRWA